MSDIEMTVGLIKALAPKPDPEDVKQSVEDWLDDHPEATTTVEDGAITKAKLNASLQGTVDDVDDLKSAITEISESVIDNIKNTTTYGWAIKESDGNIVARTAQRSIIMSCKANTTYTIKDPKGNRLVVGASSVMPYNGFTFTHYSDLSSSLSETSFTTGTGEVFLMVNYYTTTSATYTEEQALAALEVYNLVYIAEDDKARTDISALETKEATDIAEIYDDALVKSANLYNTAEQCRLGYALEQNGLITGGDYNDRCTIAYIPVHGYDFITAAIFSESDTGTTGRYCWYDENYSPIKLSGEDSEAIGGFPLYETKDSSYVEIPSGAYYIAFQLYYEHCTLDTSGRPICMVQYGKKYTGYSDFNKTLVSTKYTKPHDIYVCAKDSDEKYRLGADYFCSGENDELVLQIALEAVGQVGTLWLAPGTYSIDSFPEQTDGQYTALQYKVKKSGNVKQTRVRIRCYDQTPMREDGYSIINHCATLKVSSACYSALDSSENYSVIGVEHDGEGTRVWNGACFDLSGIGIQIPGNQKKIVAFDAWYAFCIMMERCMATAIPTNAMPSAAGDEDCIGIKCTKGSNFGQASQLTTCACYGFGQGIAVSGEHYVLTNCKTIYNKYGFTFNWYGDSDAGYTHPNTLINCCSEMDFNYPYFGYNGQTSSVTLIDFNLEYRTASAALGGELAQELVPGSWRGSINYTIKTYASDGYGSTTGNNVAMPFWKSGHGANVKSHNDAQKQICTTTERNSYAANELQRVYDSTAEKFYTYVNGSWVEG